MQYTKLETMSAHAIRVDFLAALNEMKKKNKEKIVFAMCGAYPTTTRTTTSKCELDKWWTDMRRYADSTDQTNKMAGNGWVFELKNMLRL